MNNNKDKMSWLELSFYITGGLIILAGLLEFAAMLLLFTRL